MRPARSGVTERTHSTSGRYEVLTPIVSDQQPFRVPATDADADGMLANAKWRVREMPYLADAVLRDVARFLGAAGRVWTPSRRLRLAHLLASGGGRSVSPVIDVVTSTPREEVADAAIAVLADIMARDVLLAADLAQALTVVGRCAPPLDQAVAREVVVRALGDVFDTPARDMIRIALVSVLDDESPRVRDAAVRAIVATKERGLVGPLRARRSVERDGVVAESIDEAIGDLEVP